MMLTLAPHVPPIPSARDVQTFFDLIDLLAKPSETKKRIEQYQAASTAAQKILADVEKAQGDLKVEREKVHTEIVQARADWNEELSNGRSAWKNEVAEREAAIELREKETAAAHSAALADREAAAKFKAELDRRFQIMQGLAS